MELFDFDAHFGETLNVWIEQNRKRFKSPEAMEDAAADLYETWLQTPADWLDGLTPGGYYRQFDDAGALVVLLRRHIAEDVPVPDPLLTRLAALNDETALLALVRDASAPGEARMTGISLLRQMDSRAPMVDYIRWQVTREVEEDLLDNALESLRDMGEAVRRPAKMAFAAADDAGREALLDVLADFPADDDVVAYAIRRFEQCPDKRALFAGYLGKLGDERALAPLLDAAEGAKVSYIDFIEIRNAIERLGGEAPVRDFEGDPTYIAVKRLQKR
jgi:hypothetical protein